MIRLSKAENSFCVLVLDYVVTHSTPGREGTTLTANLKVRSYVDRAVAELMIDQCESATPVEAIERLAVWLDRLAVGLRDRKDTTIPV